ncbi:MAG: CvpA family protein, partial [Clostridiales bacterium]|nr:CvpA family protein [Clostridiales bacterium]
MNKGQNGFSPGFQIRGNISRAAVSFLCTALAGFIYFYLSLPAINIHATEFYVFIGFLCAVYFVCALFTSGMQITGGIPEYIGFVKKQCKLPALVLVAFIVLYVFGSVSSWMIFRAGDYSKLIKVEQGNFAQDVEEISFDKIPMLDKESAQKLGDRKLGELSDMVSQFEVSNDYSQINYKNRPVRVTPLVYGDLIKWLNNRGKGLPAYLIIDMASQDVQVVRLNNGMKYSESEHFGRKIERYIRFRYPTYMFDKLVFEIDDNKTPYWICPKIVKKIGLFGGTDIDGAVLVNAVTGETKYYKQVPDWVDKVYSSDLIVEQYDFYGKYHKGFLNSMFGQKDVTVTTSGHNYIAMNDAVYVYT